MPNRETKRHSASSSTSSSGKATSRSTRWLIPRLIVTVFKAAPLSSIGLTISAVVGGAIIAAELAIGRQVVDTLSDALTGVGGRTVSDVLVWVGWLAATMIGGIILEMISSLSEVDVQEKVSMHMQRQVIDKALAVELVHFEHPEFYDTLERANQDMGGRLVQLMRSMVDILGSVSGIAAIVTVLFAHHWALAPLTIIGVVPGFWVMLSMRKKTYWVYRIRTPESRLAIYFNSLLTRRDEAKEVRLFTLARHLLDEWLTLSKRLAVERRQLELRQAWLGAATEWVGLATYAGCLMIIGSLVTGFQVTVGTFTMLMDAIGRFTQRIEQAMRSMTALHEQSLYLGDLYEFLEVDVPMVKAESVDDAPSVHDKKDAQIHVERDAITHDGRDAEIPVGRDVDVHVVGKQSTRGVMTAPGNGRSDTVTPATTPLLPTAARIDVDNVSFVYPGGHRPVLRNVTFSVEAGKRIALIGENGAGKSTLVRIMMGLYEPTEGRVLIDGVDLRDIPRDQRFKYFAAVFQEYVNYQFTVADNIRFGRIHTATDADVHRASQLAGAHEFVEHFPEGYDTLLGRPLGGLDVSGGQWQKLAIARALVRQAPIVVLDEPTAALDPKAEAEIYRQFGEMTEGRTSIMISHRLGSARLAQEIIVLKDGELEERGTHEQLMEKGGEYAGFFSLQAQWYN